jgi:hypothetical protein
MCVRKMAFAREEVEMIKRGVEGEMKEEQWLKGDKTLMRHIDGRGLVSDSSRTTILRVEVRTHTPKNNEKEMRAAC